MLAYIRKYVHVHFFGPMLAICALIYKIHNKFTYHDTQLSSNDGVFGSNMAQRHSIHSHLTTILGFVTNDLGSLESVIQSGKVHVGSASQHSS